MDLGAKYTASHIHPLEMYSCIHNMYLCIKYVFKFVSYESVLESRTAMTGGFSWEEVVKAW
jgi:hypothetical protein